MRKIDEVLINRRNHYCLMYDKKYIEVFTNHFNTVQAFPHDKVSSRFLYSSLYDVEIFKEMLITKKPFGKHSHLIKEVIVPEEFNDPSKFKIVKVVLEQNYIIYDELEEERICE